MASKAKFLGAGMPNFQDSEINGRLIVLEGPDCVGRTTQINLLQDWLESLGYGVVTTSLCRSELAEEGLSKAKRGNQIDVQTLALFYATDMADRMERLILPALESGFIVLSDRYVYTILARYGLRGVDPEWLAKVFGFALKPDLTLYLNVDIDVLVKRALLAEKLGFWECGMDLNLDESLYESFIVYQKRMIKQFSRMTKEHKLAKVSAHGTIASVQQRLRKKVRALLDVKETELDAVSPLSPVLDGDAG
jgi:dTMP kinase